MDELLKTPLEGFFRWPKFQTPVWPAEAKPDLHVTKFADFKICEPKKRLGIEVEVEGITRTVNCDAHVWAAKADGSLRNHGAEYVSYALAGHEVIYAVNDLMEHLPASADFSERTSIHIHVNVREQNIGQLLMLLTLYTTFEQLLFEFAGPQRRKNIFCVALQETRYPYLIANFLKHGSLATLMREWKKYSGLNINCLRTFGTIEYRIMEGHRDAERLLNWINIILRMHQYVRRTDFRTMYDEIRNLNTNSMYEQFVHNVFKSDAPVLLRNVQNLQQLLESGVSITKAFAVPSDFVKSVTNDVQVDSTLLTRMGIKEYPPVAKKESLGNTFNAYTLGMQAIYAGGNPWLEPAPRAGDETGAQVTGVTIPPPGTPQPANPAEIAYDEAPDLEILTGDDPHAWQRFGNVRYRYDEQGQLEVQNITEQNQI